jgi:hypothetical protein
VEPRSFDSSFVGPLPTTVWRLRAWSLGVSTVRLWGRSRPRCGDRPRDGTALFPKVGWTRPLPSTAAEARARVRPLDRVVLAVPAFFLRVAVQWVEVVRNCQRARNLASGPPGHASDDVVGYDLSSGRSSARAAAFADERGEGGCGRARGRRRRRLSANAAVGCAQGRSPSSLACGKAVLRRERSSRCRWEYRPLAESGMRKRELASHFGVSEKTVQRWVARGCPHTRSLPGGPLDLDPAGVARWLAQRAGTGSRARSLVVRAAAREEEDLVRAVDHATFAVRDLLVAVLREHSSAPVCVLCGATARRHARAMGLQPPAPPDVS